MTNYAYLTGSGILHISQSREIAVGASKTGKVVETAVPCSGGYPFADGEEIIVYSQTDMRLEANGNLLNAAKYPQLAQLYQSCR